MIVSEKERRDVDKFKYLEVVNTGDSMGGGRRAHRILEGRKVWELVAMVWKENMLSAQERRKIEIFESMCLRIICGIGRVDSVRSLLNKREMRV